MLFSVDWLSDFVDTSEWWAGPADTPGAVDTARLRALGDRLTAVGMAVEGVALHARASDGRHVPLFDVDVTTNRPDAMCHFGLARELAVALAQPLRAPRAALREAGEDTARHVRVELLDPAACPRYAGRVIRGVKVGPSPDWLQDRLRAIGLRPISNVVDVTNYVLWELGQPLHAFDLAKLRRGADGVCTVAVRRARAGEALRTLDGELRKLDPSILVIADGERAERAVALGGIMGGADTEVGATTVDVFLEGAHFDRRTVRQGAKALGMHTDASHRFERGTDPDGCAFAVRRAAALIAEIAGGEVLAGGLETVSAEHLPAPAVGTLEHARLCRFIGAEVALADVERILAGLGFGAERRGEGAWRVTVPSFRRYDFEPMPRELRNADGETVEEQELFEEVLRQHGFARVAPTLPRLAGTDAGRNPTNALRHRVRDILAACGLVEVVNFSFASQEAEPRFPALERRGEPLQLVNPIAETHAILRRSLLPNLLESAEFNWRRGARAVRLFETAHVFPGGDGPELDAVALIVGGTLGTPWDRQRELDLFDCKGVLEALAEGCGLRLQARPATLPGFVPGSAAELVLGDGTGAAVGYFGRLGLADAPFAVFAAELRLDALRAADGPQRVDVPSRFPGVAVDLTLTHPLTVTWSELAAAIASHGIADLRGFALKDRYQGKGVPDGAVNTTIAFLYGAEDRSLTQDEVNARHGALRAALEERFGWRA